jgi:hypothetical protein
MSVASCRAIQRDPWIEANGRRTAYVGQIVARAQHGSTDIRRMAMWNRQIGNGCCGSPCMTSHAPRASSALNCAVLGRNLFGSSGPLPPGNGAIAGVPSRAGLSTGSGVCGFDMLRYRDLPFQCALLGRVRCCRRLAIAIPWRPGVVPVAPSTGAKKLASRCRSRTSVRHEEPLPAPGALLGRRAAPLLSVFLDKTRVTELSSLAARARPQIPGYQSIASPRPPRSMIQSAEMACYF